MKEQVSAISFADARTYCRGGFRPRCLVQNGRVQALAAVSQRSDHQSTMEQSLQFAGMNFFAEKLCPTLLVISASSALL